MADLIMPLIMASLATWGAVETWHHGEIFANTRAFFEVKTGVLSEILGCPFCLSHWGAMFFTLLVFTQRAWVFKETSTGFILEIKANSEMFFTFPIFWLATTRLSNLLNDYFHRWCRTPRVKISEEDLKLLDDIKEQHEKPFIL